MENFDINFAGKDTIATAKTAWMAEQIAFALLMAQGFKDGEIDIQRRSNLTMVEAYKDDGATYYELIMIYKNVSKG